MSRRQYAFNSEIELNYIPVSFIEEEMQKLHHSWIIEEDTERQDRLELSYRILECLIKKWRDYE